MGQPINNLQDQPHFVHPGRRPTNQIVMNLSVIDTMMGWNFLLPSSFCCTFHAGLEVLGSIHSNLLNYPCSNALVEGAPHHQCRQCGIMCDVEEVGDRCLMCDHSHSSE